MSSFWYDPIVGNTGGSGLQNAYDSQAQTNNWNAQQANTLATANAFDPWANSPGGFGGQTNYYSGLGAAYGRSVPSSADAAKAAAAGQNPLGPDPWSGTGFDPVKYLQSNPDVAAAGVDPWTHVQQHGYTEGREGAGWNPEEYLQQNPDVAASGMDPWIHARRFGFPEGRSGLEGLPPAPDFDGTFSPFGIYKHQLDNQPAINAVNGAALPFQAPSSDDVFGSPLNYAPAPVPQGNTGQLFDSIKYLQNNPDVLKAGMSGYEHYDKFGRNEGREATWGNPFDSNTYLRLNNDVAQSGMDPRTHWLLYGQKEGRQGGGVLNETRDAIAATLASRSNNWAPMTGGNASAQQLVNQGAGLNMRSGFGGSTYYDNKMYGAPSSGYLGAQGANVQDPFSAYVNPQSLDAGGSFPANYQPGYNAVPLIPAPSS